MTRRSRDLIRRGDKIRTCGVQFPKLALYRAELHPELLTSNNDEEEYKYTLFTILNQLFL
jgi:hypothetical protein